MLQIRREQMESLTAYMQESFRERMAVRISGRFPRQHAALKPQGTLDLIDRGIQKCAGHGIKAERDVAAMIELMVEFGPDFEVHRDRLTWAPALLKNPKLSPPAKVDVLYVKITGRVREG
jgi:hypothetical protein